MTGHEHFEDLMTEKLDGVISAADEASLEAHLASCPDCRELYGLLAGAHGALDFEAEAPADLLPHVMEAVRAEKNRKKIRVRAAGAAAGILVAAAVLAVAVVPGAIRSKREDVNAGIAPASLTKEDTPLCYTPSDTRSIPLPPDDDPAETDGPTENVSAENGYAGCAGVVWLTALPEDLPDTARKVPFPDGSVGVKVTREQFQSLLDGALKVEYPNPDGEEYMVIAAAK